MVQFSHILHYTILTFVIPSILGRNCKKKSSKCLSIKKMCMFQKYSVHYAKISGMRISSDYFNFVYFVNLIKYDFVFMKPHTFFSFSKTARISFSNEIHTQYTYQSVLHQTLF